MKSQKIFIIFVLIVISLLIVPFSFSKAFQWNHSENQVPFDGYYANYEGWYYNIEDPLNPLLPRYDMEMNILYYDTNVSDLLIQFNLAFYVSWTGNSESATYKASTFLTNRTIIDIELLEGEITVYNFILFFLGDVFGDIFWCRNNLSIGENVTPFKTNFGALIDDIVNYNGFTCYHAIQAGNNMIAHMYYDTFSGAGAGWEVTMYFPVKKQIVFVQLVSGNFPRATGISTTNLLILLGIGVGVLGGIIAYGYRARISIMLGRKKKDKSSRRKRYLRKQ